jgi:hypothetical protein
MENICSYVYESQLEWQRWLESEGGLKPEAEDCSRALFSIDLSMFDLSISGIRLQEDTAD